MTAPAPMTLNAGIWKLPAGCLAECDDEGGLVVRRYWDCLPQPPRHATRPELAATARRLVEQAVDRQLMADVPIGIFLSGGIDSTALLALASRRGPVDAFTVGFGDDPEGSEVEAAAATANRFGARHHVVTIDAADAQSYLERLVHDQDEPLADWVCVPLHFLAESARQNGIKVVLVGEGADEQFCGYPSYRRYLEIARGPWRIARLLGALGLARPLMRHFASDPYDVGRMMRADFLRRASAGEECFIGGAVVVWDMMRSAIEGPALRDALPSEAAAFDNSALMQAASSGDVVADLLQPLAGNGADQLARMTYLECKFRLPELLLMRVDKITMAASIEARVPFLDRDIVDFSMRLSQGQKIPGGDLKHILKQALRGIVPDDVLARRKRGFDAPAAVWLRGPFGRRCRDEVMDSSLLRAGWLNGAYVDRLFADHMARTTDNAVLLWTVYNLVAWHHHWCRP
jgi:asparagine synthase (glutamine-hydrolysing)